MPCCGSCFFCFLPLNRPSRDAQKVGFCDPSPPMGHGATMMPIEPQNEAGSIKPSQLTLLVALFFPFLELVRASPRRAYPVTPPAVEGFSSGAAANALSGDLQIPIIPVLAQTPFWHNPVFRLAMHRLLQTVKCHLGEPNLRMSSALYAGSFPSFLPFSFRNSIGRYQDLVEQLTCRPLSARYAHVDLCLPECIEQKTWSENGNHFNHPSISTPEDGPGWCARVSLL